MGDGASTEKHLIGRRDALKWLAGALVGSVATKLAQDLGQPNNQPVVINLGSGKATGEKSFLANSVATASLTAIITPDSTPTSLPAPSAKAKPTETPIVQPTATKEVIPYNAPQPDLKSLENKYSRFKPEIIEAARTYMAIGVPEQGERNERTELEEKLFHKLEDENAPASDILFALKSAGTIDGRSWGMQLLWNKRQSGELREFGMEPLDQARIDWAIKNEIDPRILANCRDSFTAVFELLDVGRDLFFEGRTEEELKNMRIETKIPNPGVIAKLMMTETGNANPYAIGLINRLWGMVYIGGANAWDEINLDPDIFPLGHDHLERIAKMLENETGLPYMDNVRTIPGSQRGDIKKNLSGGAIGPQFMPLNALTIMEKYKIANERLGNKYPTDPNIFDPIVANILSTVFIASSLYARHPDTDDVAKSIKRPGYDTTGTEEDRIKALEKWNPSGYQPELAMDAGDKHNREIGRL